MPSTDVFAPGRHRSTPRELLEQEAAEEIVAEWEEAMDRIERAERAVDSEEAASIRIR